MLIGRDFSRVGFSVLITFILVLSPIMVPCDRSSWLKAKFHYASQVPDFVADLVSDPDRFEPSRHVEMARTCLRPAFDPKKSQAGRRPARTCRKPGRKPGLRPGLRPG